MRVAVASGKGGTGKTTVATNLAWLASQDGQSTAYLDCDVEEPNGALFLKPDITETRPVQVSVPEVDMSACIQCGKCGEICQYSAILLLGEQVLVYPEMCHGCSGCWLVCPTNAIEESHRTTGRLELGAAGEIKFVQGLLNIGETMSPPVIRAVKGASPTADLLIIDAPPGTSCPVIESVRDADFVLLVTEPTPFGLSDLNLAVEMVRALELPFGVVVNRAEDRRSETHQYCEAQSIRILAEIPDDRRIAETYSNGGMICEDLPDYRLLFAELLEQIVEKAGRHAA
jgi:MinD superfamily P-loop ATPase